MHCCVPCSNRLTDKPTCCFRGSRITAIRSRLILLDPTTFPTEITHRRSVSIPGLIHIHSYDNVTRAPLPGKSELPSPDRVSVHALGVVSPLHGPLWGREIMTHTSSSSLPRRRERSSPAMAPRMPKHPKHTQQP